MEFFCPACRDKGCEWCYDRRKAAIDASDREALDFLKAELEKNRLTNLQKSLIEAGVLQNIIRAAIQHGRELERKVISKEIRPEPQVSRFDGLFTIQMGGVEPEPPAEEESSGRFDLLSVK